MTQKESLEILDKVCCLVDGMTDDQFFDFMMENSETFRKEIAKIEFDLNVKTNSDFRFNEGTYVSTTFFMPQDFSNLSTDTEKIFKRTEEVEAIEWQMITEAA